MSPRVITIVAIVSSIVAVAAIAFSLLQVFASGDGAPDAAEAIDHDFAARVGDQVLLLEEVSLLHGDATAVEQWVEDELLAQLAVREGLEDERISRFVQRRARQVYLRDLMVERVLAQVHRPSSSQVFEMMVRDSLLYMVERHYYHILLADSAIADSIHRKLLMGEHFQTMAERMSMGQKSAIGGDLGFMVGGELTGFPPEVGLLDGLSEVYSSHLGYHIFLTTEQRELTDTTRVIASLREVLYRQWIDDRIETLLELARAGTEIEVRERWSTE